MYKIKESSGKSVIIRFAKQSDVNYQSVCIMNEMKTNSCLLSADFQIKLFKVQVVFNPGEFTCLKDIIKGQIDAETFAGLLADVFNSVAGFSSTGLDPRGLIYRPECMFVNVAGQVKMIYAPAYDFDESNTVDAFISSLLKLKENDPEICNTINQCYSVFCGNAPVSSGPASFAPSGDFSEGETTVLSAQPVKPDFSEGETTVLSAQPVKPDFSEGETTVLSAQPAAPMQSVTPVQSATPMFSEGETTVLSADDSPFAQNSVTDDDDYYNENATCLVLDSDFGDSDSVTNGRNDDNISGNLYDYNYSHLPENTGDYSEKETTYPHVGHPLNNDRTLIGTDGLAQAMAYSSIRPNHQAAESYETVLLADESTDKTAFFIRFINSQAVYVTKNYFTIGSGSDMDYMISGNSLVSKFHATVCIEDSRFFIIDNNSTNKLYVDGREAVPYEKNEIFTGSRVVLANEIFDFYIK
ncbi:MAG: FHA domain-containing protein [Clostridia bacterium]|nr:FHA domain-containing protein [Clostridia bacterium]